MAFLYLLNYFIYYLWPLMIFSCLHKSNPPLRIKGMWSWRRMWSRLWRWSWKTDFQTRYSSEEDVWILQLQYAIKKITSHWGHTLLLCFLLSLNLTGARHHDICVRDSGNFGCFLEGEPAPQMGLRKANPGNIRSRLRGTWSLDVAFISRSLTRNSRQVAGMLPPLTLLDTKSWRGIM